MPARFSATRAPGPDPSSRSWCDSRPRTRPRRPPGSITTSSSTASVPPPSVPVTTVPAPLCRERPVDPQPGPAAVGGDRRVPRARRRTSARTASMPRPDSESAATTGQPADARPREPVVELELRELEGLRVDEVGLREHDDPVLDAEQLEDAQRARRSAASILRWPRRRASRPRPRRPRRACS